MQQGWIWADDESMASPFQFAWGDEEPEDEWEGSLEWDEEEDDLDEEWDDEDEDEDEEDDEEWEEWEDEFDEDEAESFGRRRLGRHEWN